MTRAQRVVGIGALGGILSMCASLALLTPALSAADPSDMAGRLAVALRWDALAILPLFLAIGAVGNARFASEAIDPTAGRESRAMLINGRVVDNTVQQYLLFIAATLAVAASGGDLAVVRAAALIFIVARFAFWIGYRIDPLYRAFGMSATMYLSLSLFGYAVWLNVRS